MVTKGGLDLRSALVIYGTETGTSQDLAKEVGRILERYRFEAHVEEFDEVHPQHLVDYHLTVFVLSTTGQGEFPSNARSFWTSLLRKKLTSTFLKGVTYTIVGLGDSSYPKFNWAARKLHKRIQQLGANSLLQPCEADEQGEDSTDGAFIAWSASFKAVLDEHFPLPEGEHVIPDDEILPSNWVLAPARLETSRTQLVEHRLNGNSPRQGIQLQVAVEVNQRMTPEDHWQDVRLLRLRSHDRVPYLPGDVLAVKPCNMSEDVDAMLQTLGWQDIADHPLALRPNKESQHNRLQLPDASLRDPNILTIRELLTHKFDFNAIPKRSFFDAIAQYTDNEMHKERLLEFTDPQYLDEYYDYATRPRRSILETLQEFDSVKIPWQEAINIFPYLRARQFSIASGGRQKEEGNVFELLVAIVKYRTVIKRVRQGVCTRYLAQLPKGSLLNVTLKTEGRLHTPQQLAHSRHLLIGAGTGIAPLRAIIAEKHDSVAQGHNLLIFGCRNAAADFFFEDEWKELAEANTSHGRSGFELITAFSRDQSEKVYVQDRIRQHANKIRSLLLDESATIVVCGSSGAMPKAIRQSLVDILGDLGGNQAMEAPLSADMAEKFLAKLEKDGRYKQETW